MSHPRLPVLARLAPGVRRLLAPNPGMMTGPGTNTYLVGDDDVTVVDPGPSIEAHVDRIVETAAGAISKVIVTHTHRDHSPAASDIASRLGVPLVGRPPPPGATQDGTFSPDVVPEHCDEIETGAGRLTVILTPGHASNHVCYLHAATGLLFTGDHIMNGSTVVIAPPDGDMSAYIDSLQALKAFEIDAIAPGHGEVIDEPWVAIDWLIAHRLERESKVAAALGRVGSGTVSDLLADVYDDVGSHLHRVASLSLEAHLIKLERDGRAVRTGETWSPR